MYTHIALHQEKPNMQREKT